MLSLLAIIPVLQHPQTKLDVTVTKQYEKKFLNFLQAGKTEISTFTSKTLRAGICIKEWQWQ